MRAAFPAFAALDTFAVANLFDVHFAGFHAGAAVRALAFVDLDPEKRDRIEKRIYSSERTDEAAERAVTE